jgi:hypothetical protein
MASALVKELLPAFVAELEKTLIRMARPELAEQLGQLRVVDRCRCSQRNCSHFYTAPRPLESYGPNHTNLMIPAQRGLIVFDIVDGVVVAIEVLDRPDVKAPLDQYLPP